MHLLLQHGNNMGTTEYFFGGGWNIFQGRAIKRDSILGARLTMAKHKIWDALK